MRILLLNSADQRSTRWSATVLLAIQLQCIGQLSTLPKWELPNDIPIAQAQLESGGLSERDGREFIRIARTAEKPAGDAPAIPLRSETAGTALSYHAMPVDLSKPISNEPLVKATEMGLSSKSFYHIADGSNGPYNRQIQGSLPDVWLRQSVANKLLAVNQKLAPLDLEVHIFDGYRPIETQQSLWDHFIEKGRHELETSDPQKLREFAGRFASDPHGFNPADPSTWPTHNTGGAVDLTLRRKSTGKLLDMGGEFDDASPISFADALEKERMDDRARNNRRILYSAMTREGFANYPYEWWHYDYGTQMWSQNHCNAEAGTKAWYGPATLPTEQ